jgi:apolipoprotein D and lipocalin family protein
MKTVILNCFIFMISINAMSQPLETVPYVDLERYAGLWYEIASYPQRFQKGCHNTTAEYSLSEKGHVVVINRCNKDSIDGRQSLTSRMTTLMP